MFKMIAVKLTNSCMSYTTIKDIFYSFNLIDFESLLS